MAQKALFDYNVSMRTLKTILICFSCIYAFHAFDWVKTEVLNFFSAMEQKILPSDKRTDLLNTLMDTVEPTPAPTGEHE